MWPLVLVPLVLAGLAGAQLSSRSLSLFGREAQSVVLGGAEYARADVLGPTVRVAREGEVVRVEGLGRVLLLPIDRDQNRASAGGSTVQLGLERVQARTATLLNGSVYLPLDTVARGLGAQYEPGRLALPEARVTGVSSRAGRDADRVVLDLNRDVRFTTRLTPTGLEVVLPATKADTRNYSTRGRFLPRVSVRQVGADALLSVPLDARSGYRVFRSQRGSVVRLVLDVGPGIPSTVPAVRERVRSPLIVLDPGGARETDRVGDVALEVAREAGDLLTRAGWRVRLTRSGRGSATLGERADLARQSDVFVTLDVSRVPGSQARGLTVYEGRGATGFALTDAVRGGGSDTPLERLVVADVGDNRRLTQLLLGELKAQDVPARSVSASRLRLLREAPRAALVVELGSALVDADVTRLSEDEGRREMAVALARSVASFLAAQAAKAGGS